MVTICLEMQSNVRRSMEGNIYLGVVLQRIKSIYL